jgi:hypothetical protein
MHFDTVKIHPRRSIVPRTAEKIHAVPARCYPAKNFAKVKLGASGLGILIVLPVQYKYAH